MGVFEKFVNGAKFLKIPDSHRVSLRHRTIPMNSASILLKATEACFLHPQLRGIPQRKVINPEKLFLSSLSDAQEASVYVYNLSSGDFDNVCKDFGISPNSLVKVPLHVGETYQKPSSSDEEETEFPYRSLVGSLLFLASRTRPDLLFPTILLSQFNTSHSLKHVKMLKQILQIGRAHV